MTASLPKLPFEDGQFDIAVCSHLLFLYSNQLSLDFHLASIEELLRVAAEVQGFPYSELGAENLGAPRSCDDLPDSQEMVDGDCPCRLSSSTGQQSDAPCQQNRSSTLSAASTE